MPDIVSISALGVNIASLTADILSLRFLTKGEDMNQTFAIVTNNLTNITKTIEANVKLLDKKDAQRFKNSAQQLINQHRSLYNSNERRRAEETGRRRRELKESIRVRLEGIKSSSDTLLLNVQSASNLAKLQEISEIYNLSAVALTLTSMDVTDSQNPFE
ncbi:hypothetical protein NLJ89_g637 [Agrocybe chaxingu]|uniref:Uncharacterized protein n=1 Tax=Agrocybe chaxingu TaxID=84603 RepID=A0A9W8TG97_9AGAR|nr:hypothetical protein NLJ89_g637 [Agrocybe chaxingu]